MFISLNFSIASYTQEILLHKTKKWESQFKETKLWILIHTWTDKAFKSTVVNQALTSLHKELLEITLI